MFASQPALRRNQPFSSHPLAWLCVSALLVALLATKPPAIRQPVDSSATPVAPASHHAPPTLTHEERAAIYPWLLPAQRRTYESLAGRLPAPWGFIRVAAAPGSFGDWLRYLPVRPPGSPVLDHERKVVRPGDAPGLAAVVELQPSSPHLLDAANIIVRLRAEYLWSSARLDQIEFRFTSGAPFAWTDWRDGLRPIVSGRDIRWVRTDTRDDSRGAFAGYLETLFRYGSIASLQADTIPVTDQTVQPGDVFVVPGRPGRAACVLDVATGPDGDVSALLGCGGTPVRTFHVVAASPASPWFEMRAGSTLILPDHGPARMSHLRRWLD
jgi:hypothetical protein